MRYLVLITSLLILSAAFALDPPVKLWEKQYFPNHDGAQFFDIELTPSGNLFITGSAYDYTSPYQDGYSAFLFELNGNLIWSVHHPWYTGRGLDGTILPDGSYAITGRCVETPNSTYSLFLMKIDTEGRIEWSKIYDYPDTREEGYGIASLPDGGFAVCGRVHGTGLFNGQAWILRTDELGDTLWTDTWGTANTNRGYDIAASNDEICVLALGEDDTLTTYGTHLLFYSPDGEYLRGTTEDITTEPASICVASDGGYTFTNTVFPRVWHTDQYGNLLWWKDIYVTPNDWHKGYCIRQTTDSGYIFCGWDGYYEYEPGGDLVDYQEGWLARFDSEGNELWNINNAISVNHHFYSCLQLPEGGYVACGAYNVMENMDNPESKGTTGFLVRYAPETGISEPDPVAAVSLEISPNPCSSVLSLRFSLAESGVASISIYDLSGRLVDTAAEAVFPAGENTVGWAVPEDVSSGCYLIQYNSASGSISERCALVN